LPLLETGKPRGICGRKNVFDKWPNGDGGMRSGAEGPNDQDSLEEDDYLICRSGRIWVAEVSQLLFEKLVQSFGVCPGDLVGRVSRVGESEFSGDVTAAAEAWGRSRLIQLIDDGKDPQTRIGAGGCESLSVSFLVVAGRLPERLGDEGVLATEVLVERPPGNGGRLQDGVDADGDALARGKALCRREKAIPRPRRLGTTHAASVAIPVDE
jgi:hypothetical protein